MRIRGLLALFAVACASAPRSDGADRVLLKGFAVESVDGIRSRLDSGGGNPTTSG